MWTLSAVPSVSVLTRFDCSNFLSFVAYTEFVNDKN